jgi:hypothetical protein
MDVFSHLKTVNNVHVFEYVLKVISSCPPHCPNLYPLRGLGNGGGLAFILLLKRNRNFKNLCHIVFCFTIT